MNQEKYGEIILIQEVFRSDQPNTCDGIFIGGFYDVYRVSSKKRKKENLETWKYEVSIIYIPSGYVKIAIENGDL